MNRNTILLILLVTFVTGCENPKKRDIETILSEMKSIPIELCLDRMVCRYENRDTCVSEEQCYDYKMVIYMDSIKGAYKKGSSHSIAWARYNCKPNEVTHTGCCTKSGLYSGEKKLA